MKYEDRYPLTSFLKQNDIKEDDFIQIMLKNILGLYDKNFLTFIKNHSSLGLSRYKYIRAHNDYHHNIYKKLWKDNQVVSKVSDDIYFKEIPNYFRDLFIGSEYSGCHIWGFTRNPFLYNSLWNVWYVPRYYAYLTDNSNGGELGKNLRNKLKEYIIECFKDEIIAYNKYMIYKAGYFSKILRSYLSSYNIRLEPKNKKRSLRNVSKQLVLINLKDRNIDVMEILDSNFEVVTEIASLKDIKLKDYTY